MQCAFHRPKRIQKCFRKLRMEQDTGYGEIYVRNPLTHQSGLYQEISLREPQGVLEWSDTDATPKWENRKLQTYRKVIATLKVQVPCLPSLSHAQYTISHVLAVVQLIVPAVDDTRNNMGKGPCSRFTYVRWFWLCYVYFLQHYSPEHNVADRSQWLEQFQSVDDRQQFTITWNMRGNWNTFGWICSKLVNSEQNKYVTSLHAKKTSLYELVLVKWTTCLRYPN